MSRGYLNHRFSDDLDLFVNNDDSFQKHIEKAISSLEQEGIAISFDKNSSPDFTRIYVDQNKNGLDKKGLKIDFVNDIPVHFGNIAETSVYYRTDSIRNILSNKYTALYRISAKDVVDICTIAENYSFNWSDIIKEADQKEGGLDGKEIVQIFSCFSNEDFEKIRWIEKPEIKEFRKKIATVAKDMLEGRENTLFQNCTVQKFRDELNTIITPDKNISDSGYMITFQSITSKLSIEKRNCIENFLKSQGATSAKDLPKVLRKISNTTKKQAQQHTKTIDDFSSMSD